MLRCALLALLALPFWPGCAATAVKGEAEPVLLEGKRLYEAGEYPKAQAHFRGVTRFHPDSDEAEEAQFMLAETRRQRRHGSAAFENYKQFVDKYPNSRFAVGAAVGEYELGLAHLEGRMPGFLFFKAERGYGVRILEHMQVHFRNHSLADDALVQVVNYYTGKEDWVAAAETLDRLLAEYPRSEYMLWARFQLGRCLWLQSKGPLYDERVLLRSRRAFEDYIGTARLLRQEEGQEEQIARARETILKIDERRAEKEYLIGRFYERTKHPVSAAYYYRHCIRSFPGTEYAGLSEQRLKALGAEATG